ncbi:MAG: Leucine aminopeptidase-related protein [uncultured Sphingomonas sp.]|uniref:Leucine aminopeptidase-related protein n=1 Tax=uncultured Sphingomonas sp. TaxID=158754 RepID=A0A6J4T209_9SPHN|nr:M28 family peptidase [uncultured Sphingomonas sp.]CAA9511129.1 MAG: Leucine aminopeptidase-related protein [uncultured Sphingomonas sp.]
MRQFAFLPFALSASAAAAVPPPPITQVVVGDAFARVQQQRLRGDIQKLVSFGTRHTLSSQTDPKRGIGASVRWAEAEMKRLGLPTLQTCDTVTGRRVPTPTRVCNAVAIQRGTERPNDVVIITGHIDSRVTDVMNATADSPGANDDGSGTAAVLEAARVLSRSKFPGTIVYAALSGEEQGLLGGKILADYAKAQGWNVVANLNNDIIGNSCSSDGVCNANQVRVFSEGPRWQGREDLAARQRSLGGENDSPSRNLSRYLDSLAEKYPRIGLDVMPIWRNDRFGRGGDHTEFLNAGYPAVRFSVAVENYNHQHQDLRTEGGIEYGDTINKMDFPYLTKVVKLNVAALAALASAPPPPEATVEGAVKTDTTVSWKAVRGPNFRIHCRRTDSAQWAECPVRPLSQSPAAGQEEAPGGFSAVLRGVRVDDWIFGVSAVSPNGFESPVASAVPGGAFKPYVPPPPSPAGQ